MIASIDLLWQAREVSDSETRFFTTTYLKANKNQITFVRLRVIYFNNFLDFIEYDSKI